MYYAAETPIGKEVEAVELLRTLHMFNDEDCIIPVYERAYRSGDKSRIDFAKLFPGYVLIRNIDYKDINEAQEMLDALWIVTRKKTGKPVIKTLSDEDNRFLEQILDGNIMMVSLVEMTEDREIKSIVGPLSSCWQDIEEFDFDNRAAVVKKNLFGRTIRIPFGIWSCDDPKTLWLEDKINAGEIYQMPVGVYAKQLEQRCGM